MSKDYFKNEKEKSREERFYEAECRERYAFKQWIQMYDLFQDKNRYSLYISPEGVKSPFDIIVQKYDNNMICLNRYIIELKVRMVNNNKLYNCKRDGWILQKDKYTRLKEIENVDEDRNESLYINFLPDRTIVWNLTTLEKKGLLKWINKDMNTATMSSREDKSNKKVCLLKEEWGLPYKYTFDEFLFQKDQKENDILRRRTKDTEDTANTITKLLTADTDSNKYRK